MRHAMGLYEEPFESMKTGKKEFEVRLYDEKRRKIKVGDIIEFMRIPENGETLQVEVLELRPYDTFRDMYEDIPFSLFDCEGWTMEEMLEGTYDIYTREQEKQWGTLAIKIKSK
jgi:ASC-1-like (ASCH) protein